MKSTTTDTIAAIATPPGRGGIGIIRLSGSLAKEITEKISQQTFIVRHATFSYFYDADNKIVDEGIILYFAAPNSFTGEEVVELQTHGSPIMLDCILNRLIQLGARLAEPGEFSKRAFLNDKIDLIQAEAIADLIEASSLQAARSAMLSLQGEFSKKINDFLELLIQLRIYVEAAIDFPEEEIDFLSDGKILNQLKILIGELNRIKISAKQGNLLKEGMQVVIAGQPNVGKSSLLNALSEIDSAIVTPIAGTTRDILKEHIQIDGMPLHIFDTAGLRDSEDPVEQEGIKRAKTIIAKADEILFLTDSTQPITDQEFEKLTGHLPKKNITLIRNKIDLINEEPSIKNTTEHTIISISAKQKQGIDLLKQHLKQKMGYQSIESVFIARKRHLIALEKTAECLESGLQQLTQFKAGECLAEELRIAQEALSSITGDFTNDDLLGRIFSSFCIGK